MTALKGLFTRTVPTPPPMTVAERAQMAGKLLRASMELDRPFVGDIEGWRVRVDRIEEIREGTAADLGLTPETFG